MKCLFAIASCLFLSLTGFSQSFTTQSYRVGSGPAQLIVADFNGDHIPDLATVNNSANTVSILINNGKGTFRPHVDFAAGAEVSPAAETSTCNRKVSWQAAVADSQPDPDRGRTAMPLQLN